MSALTQLYYRAPKSVGIIQASPIYEELQNFPEVTEDVRVSTYSPDGKYFAFTQPNCVVVVNPDDGSVVHKIELKDVFDIHFSPLSSYIVTWERPVKLESGNYHNNVKFFNISTKELLAEYSNKDQSGWKPEFTADEKRVARQFKNEIKFYEVEGLNFNKAWSTLKIENVSTMKLSPGQKQAVAIFVPEKSGKPATVAVYPIEKEIKRPLVSKSFFKAERCVLKWNNPGTALLALASTDVDSSNKSYYGETTLYLLGVISGYDSRIALDKEGPIHDISWSPSSREFGVIYGYMPAKTSFFDSRGAVLYSLPPAPKNTILFSPHGKYILVAGFGNLQGTVDIYDRQQKFSKVTTFEAPNTSVCQWSPDGRYILTATTAPRLRVDNGIKIWYANGTLIYNRDFKEVYSVDWRPRSLDIFPPIKLLDDKPAVHSSVAELQAKKPLAQSSLKPKGAYRPPHQRNGAAPAAPKSLYERELSISKPPGLFVPQQRVKVIPGAPIPVEKETKSAAKNRKKREKKHQQQQDSNSNSATPEPDSQHSQSQGEGQQSLIVGGVFSLEEKKIRGLLKKLRAIEQLKMKQANSEPLEDTQVLKIKTEDKVRADLAALGWSETDN